MLEAGNLIVEHPTVVEIEKLSSYTDMSPDNMSQDQVERQRLMNQFGGVGSGDIYNPYTG